MKTEANEENQDSSGTVLIFTEDNEDSNLSLLQKSSLPLLPSV
jgi:hypothetical protein